MNPHLFKYWVFINYSKLPIQNIQIEEILRLHQRKSFICPRNSTRPVQKPLKILKSENKNLGILKPIGKEWFQLPIIL